MYKMCGKCGFFYDDVENPQCPQCGEASDVGTTIGNQPTDINEDYSTKCPNCGYKLDEEDYDYCPMCLFPINKTTAEEKAIDELHKKLKNRVPNENEHKCPYCGNVQSKDIHRCLKCSEIIDDENQEISEPFKDNNDNTDIELPPYSEADDISSSKKEFTELSNNNASTVNSNNDNHNSILNDYRKVAAIVLSVIFVLIIVVIAIVAKSNEPIKINLNDYISNNICTDQNIQTDIDYDDEYDQRSEAAIYYSNYTEGPGLRIYGYNQYASLETSDLKNIIDWDSLKRDIDEQLSHKRKYEKRYLDFYDFFDVDSFDFSVDNSDNISNGDSVCVTVNTKENYMFNNVTIELSDCSNTYEIDGLKTVKAFDPFDYVTFIHYNANGYASAGCRVNEDLNENIEGLDGFKVTYYSEDTIAIEKDDYIIAKIEFYFDDDTNSYHNYKNGETVTMYCSCSNDNLTDEYDIYIGVSQKEYTFSNLGEYVTKSSTISKEELSKFTDYAKSLINEEYDDYDYYSDFKLNSAYITDLKDRTEDTSYHNNLCLIYSYTYEDSWDDDKETRYLYVMFSDLIISSSGEIEFTPEDYYDRLNNDYDSVDGILSYCFGDSYNVVKI